MTKSFRGKLLRHWPAVAPWAHTAMVFGAVLVVARFLHLAGPEGAAAVAGLARLFGKGFAEVPHRLARGLFPDAPGHYIDRTTAAVAAAQTKVHEAVTDLTVIGAELQMIGDRLHSARTRFPRDGG